MISQPSRTPNRIDLPPTALLAPITPQPTHTENPFIIEITPTGLPALPTFAALQPDSSRPGDVIGTSVEGRAITAYTLGTGSRPLLLIGGIHGGYEANTVALIEALIAHFQANPADIHPSLRLILIPAANPDGLARGATAEGRFNANGVDLNRNWGCEWSREAVWRSTRVNPGVAPMSEPETAALSLYIQNTRPAVVLFYHSAARGVFAGTCGGSRLSGPMAAIYGEAAGYTYGVPFSAYPVTGTAASWVDGLGIPSADVELETRDDPEVERNLRAIMALQAWIAAQP